MKFRRYTSYGQVNLKIYFTMNVKNELKIEINNFLNTVATNYKNLVYNSNELKNPPGLFFGSTLYKGWLTKDDDIFGFKKYRIIFRKEFANNLETYEERFIYEDSNDLSKLKTFFSSIKSVYIPIDRSRRARKNFGQFSWKGSPFGQK